MLTYLVLRRFGVSSHCHAGVELTAYYQRLPVKEAVLMYLKRIKRCGSAQVAPFLFSHILPRAEFAAHPIMFFRQSAAQACAFCPSGGRVAAARLLRQPALLRG